MGSSHNRLDGRENTVRTVGTYVTAPEKLAVILQWWDDSDKTTWERTDGLLHPWAGPEEEHRTLTDSPFLPLSRS